MTHPAVPLQEVCAFRNGGTPSKANAAFWGGDIPWVSPKDMKTSLLMSTEDSITVQGVDGSATSVVPKGSILVVARSGILAHTVPVARAGRPLAFNQDIKAIQVTDQRVSGDYVYWFIRGKEAEILSRGVKKGATVHSLRSGFLERLAIPIVPASEQHRVVDLLSRAENIVLMRREAEQKAKEIVPALFLDMFGDPATNQKVWDTEPLSRISEISYGIATKLDTSVSAVTGRRILTISNVLVDGEIDWSVERYSQATGRKAETAEVKAGDLLFNWRNGSETHIGKTAIWERPETVLHVSFLLRLRPDDKRATPLYLWALLNCLRSSGFFLSASRQQVNRKFNASELSALRAPVAPLALQERFALAAKDMRRHANAQRRATELAEEAFQSLLAGTFAE